MFFSYSGEQEAKLGLFAVAALHGSLPPSESHRKADNSQLNRKSMSNKHSTMTSLSMTRSPNSLNSFIEHLPIGSCDLGGESFEIGYFSNVTSASPIVRSFSTLGVQQAVEMAHSKLNYTSDVIVQHPCYPEGYSEIRNSHIVWGTGKVESRGAR